MALQQISTAALALFYLQKYQWRHLIQVNIFIDTISHHIIKGSKTVNILQLGFVAEPVIQATGRLEFEDAVRTGDLLHIGSR